MNTTIIQSLICAFALIAGAAIVAPEAVTAQRCGLNCGGRLCMQRGCRGNRDCQTCPECDEEFCVLNCEQGEVEKTCFEIDYKTICIPKVNPPWRRNCDPACAEARSVKILKKKKYKCPKCEYKWEVVKPALPQIVDPATGQISNAQPNNSNGYDPSLPPVRQPAAPGTYYPRAMQPTTMQPPTMQPPTMQPPTMQPATMQPSTQRYLPQSPFAGQPPVMRPTMSPTYQVPNPINAMQNTDQVPPIIRQKPSTGAPPIIRANQPSGYSEYFTRPNR